MNLSAMANNVVLNVTVITTRCLIVNLHHAELNYRCLNRWQVETKDKSILSVDVGKHVPLRQILRSIVILILVYIELAYFG